MWSVEGAARSEVDSFQSGLVSDPVRATPSKIRTGNLETEAAEIRCVFFLLRCQNL